MDISKATPRPWAYDADNQTIIGPNDETIGGLATAYDDTLAIQAVNSYEPMLEALKAMYTASVYSDLSDLELNEEAAQSPRANAVLLARKAIAIAEGRIS